MVPTAVKVVRSSERKTMYPAALATCDQFTVIDEAVMLLGDAAAGGQRRGGVEDQRHAIAHMLSGVMRNVYVVPTVRPVAL